MLIIIWFGDTVTVSHLTKCRPNTNLGVSAMSKNYPHYVLILDKNKTNK